MLGIGKERDDYNVVTFCCKYIKQCLHNLHRRLQKINRANVVYIKMMVRRYFLYLLNQILLNSVYTYLIYEYLCISIRSVETAILMNQIADMNLLLLFFFKCACA